MRNQKHIPIYMRLKTIIFDFDGTICANLHELIRILNVILGEHNLDKLNANDIKKLRKKKAQDVFKTIGISVFQIPFIVRRIRKELNNNMNNIKPVKGMREVLIELKKDYKLAILTTNAKRNIDIFLNKNKLNIFDFIYTGTSLFGKDKIISRLLKELDIAKDEVIYIGDEVRDIEAAQKTGVKIIAVGWGYNLPKILLAYNPDFLVNKPSEIKKGLDFLFTN